MPTLILRLPLPNSLEAPEYDYVLSPDGQQADSHGHASAAMLPAHAVRGLEVVAVLPAQALSWHRLTLPERVLRGMVSGRMEPALIRGVLSGALEERLLDEPDQLHFAVFAATALDSSDADNTWVAACDRTWLQNNLQALESARYTVNRIAPECAPADAGLESLLVLGDAQAARLVWCSPQGVTLLPLPAGISRIQNSASLPVLAEPAALATAGRYLGNGVQAQTLNQRLLAAAQSPWNLAQLELNASSGGRLLKQVSVFWQQLLRGPQWRPVRWGLISLLVVQIVALNASAWQRRAQLANQRASIQAVLQQTFPEVQLVINAPLQMQRALDDLARARGAGAEVDLGKVVAVVSALAPKDLVLTGIDLSGRQVRLRGQGLNDALIQAMQPALDGQGLHANLRDGLMLIEPKEPR